MTVSSICGVIVISDDPEALSHFYASALGLSFEKEDHAGLDIHFGVDVGQTHFGIHPPSNFAGHRGRGGVAIAFAVSSLDEHLTRCKDAGGRVIVEPHDEGFGPVATLSDPEGNLFELTELRYEFDAGHR